MEHLPMKCVEFCQVLCSASSPASAFSRAPTFGPASAFSPAPTFGPASVSCSQIIRTCGCDCIFCSCLESLLQIPDDIIDVFRADGETDRILVDTSRFQLLR